VSLCPPFFHRAAQRPFPEGNLHFARLLVQKRTTPLPPFRRPPRGRRRNSFLPWGAPSLRRDCPGAIVLLPPPFFPFCGFGSRPPPLPNLSLFKRRMRVVNRVSVRFSPRRSELLGEQPRGSFRGYFPSRARRAIALCHLVERPVSARTDPFFFFQSLLFCPQFFLPLFFLRWIAFSSSVLAEA